MVVVWLFCGAVTAAIGRAKNRDVGESFLWGALLWVIGVIVVLCLPKNPAGGASLVGIPVRRAPARRGIKLALALALFAGYFALPTGLWLSAVMIAVIVAARTVARRDYAHPQNEVVA
jgi:hypothetical protein